MNQEEKMGWWDSEIMEGKEVMDALGEIAQVCGINARDTSKPFFGLSGTMLRKHMNQIIVHFERKPEQQAHPGYLAFGEAMMYFECYMGLMLRKRIMLACDWDERSLLDLDRKDMLMIFRNKIEKYKQVPREEDDVDSGEPFHDWNNWMEKAYGGGPE